MVYLCKPFFVLLEMVGTGVAEFVLPISPITMKTHNKYTPKIMGLINHYLKNSIW